MGIEGFRVSKSDKKVIGEITLDGSKSISNRALLIQALCKENFEIEGLSTSDDTQVLLEALKEEKESYNVGHAGTSFRFLTALLSTRKGKQTLTGSERMLNRPIGPLVEALNHLGAQIEYIDKEGYPPLSIDSPKEEWKAEVSLDATISSQFITSLCLIAPHLPKGLKINLEGELVSRPYLEMTLSLMNEFGVKHSWIENSIEIPAQDYQAKDFKVEGDWSAASYYYVMAAIADEVELKINGLTKDSWQGDSVIAEWSEKLGVVSTFAERQLILSKSQAPHVPFFEHDFLTHPDIAQSVSVICATLGIQGLFTGLQTLKIKETDRIEALKKELLKLQVFLSPLPVAKFSQKSQKQFYMQESKAIFSEDLIFESYDDHRMAMAFAPLGMLHPVVIKDPQVVSKSYPDFWKDLKKLGFEIKNL